MSPTAKLVRVWAFSIAIAFVADVVAAPPSDRILPDTTRGYLSIPDLDELVTRWGRTQLGQLMEDPVMEPFAEDLKRQLKETWTKAHRELGIEWDQVKELPTGEVAMAVVQAKGQEPALTVLVDVTDNLEKAEAFLEEVAELLAKEGATRSQREEQSVTLTIFDIPADADQNAPARKAIYFIKDGLLCATDNIELTMQLLSRFGEQVGNSLSELGPYKSVMDRCRAEMADETAQIRWFIEPIAYAEAMQQSARQAGLEPADPRFRRKDADDDTLKILKNQGFEGIRGLGGFLHFMEDRYEILHRTAIFAPGPHTKAMKMLVFPNGGDLSPQPWVPTDVAAYVTFNMDLQEAFDNFGPFFDEVVVGDVQSEEGENGEIESVWEDTLDSLKNDPLGPQIDLGADLVAHLGQRVTLITDYLLPITPTSERLLLAVETKDPAALAATIKKSMETDDEVIRREFEGHIIWEVIEREAPVDEFEISLDLPADEDPLDQGEEPDEIPEEGGRILPHAAFTVAHGQLFVASHVDFLLKILTTAKGDRALADTLEYKLVAKEIDALVPDEMSARIFVRTDEAFRPTYELLRDGRMPESETLFGQLLNAILGDNEDTELREQIIDASKLPDYQVVRRYLGPAGVSITSEQNFGWFVSGFLLNK